MLCFFGDHNSGPAKAVGLVCVCVYVCVCVCTITFEINFGVTPNSHGHARRDTDRTVLSCLAGGVNWALDTIRDAVLTCDQ